MKTQLMAQLYVLVFLFGPCYFRPLAVSSLYVVVRSVAGFIVPPQIDRLAAAREALARETLDIDRPSHRS